MEISEYLSRLKIGLEAMTSGTISKMKNMEGADKLLCASLLVYHIVKLISQTSILTPKFNKSPEEPYQFLDASVRNASL